MENKRARLAAPKAPRPDAAEVLRALLLAVLPQEIVNIERDTLVTIDETSVSVWASALAVELGRRGFAIVDAGPEPTGSSDGFKELVELTRIAERHACAGELARARLEAAAELEELGPEAEDVDGVWCDVQSKHLDALTEKLARGER